MYHNELAKLTSLLWPIIKDKNVPTQVAPSSFSSLSSFFEVKETPTPLPIKKSAQRPAPPPAKPSYIKPPSPQEPVKQPTPPPSKPKVEETTPPDEPSITLEENKKFARILPMKHPLPQLERTKGTQEHSFHFQTTDSSVHWGILPFFSGHQKETSLTLVTSIQNALSAKLALTLHSFDKEDEHLALRLKAASHTLKVLIVFTEPHSQAHIEKYFAPLVHFDTRLPSFPPLLFLGMVGDMALYFAPITPAMKDDLQAKKSLWIALQQLKNGAS